MICLNVVLFVVDIDKEFYMFWIENDMVKVFWVKFGLFENDIFILLGLYCSWM